MFQMSDLLKEGTSHFKGIDEVTRQNIEYVHKISELTRTSIGPNGMHKMVINRLNKIYFTSDAATMLGQLEIIHPAAKLAAMASKQQDDEFGDGTNLVLVLCGEFLYNSGLLLERGLHVSDVIAGYSKGGELAAKILQDLQVWKADDVTNKDQIVKGIKAAIASKQSGYEDWLAPLIADACLMVCPKNPQSFSVDDVRVAKILGGGVTDTKVVRGHVLNKGPEGTIKHVKDAKVAIFAGGVDIAKTETKDTVLLQNAAQLLMYSSSEEKNMEKLVKGIADTGVKVIVSGSSVGEMALHFIERYKMMVVKVQSKFELRRLAKAVNCRPLVNFGIPPAENLGYADSVSVEELGSTRITVFAQQHSRISTLVVRAATQNVLDDFERSIDDGVNAYKAMTKDQRYVAGAGAAEMELANQIQAKGDETPGLMQYALKKYGEAFEVIPRTLAETSGESAIEALSNLYAAHQKKQANAGVDVDTGDVCDAVERGVLDHLLTKLNAIKLATTTVVTILKVDQIIMAKMAGGPKPPQMGARDA